MVKKRLDQSRKGQITVFIILGLLLLFIFVITIKLASDVKLSDLEAEKEKVVSKNFKKEALRIYVEDCLNDALEEGLVLIGKQGRLWQDQPGGTKPFVESITGVTYQPGERIFYGISNENYAQHPNAYPCENDSYSPEFCQYQYPNTSIGFGSREIKTSTIEGDLRQYLINRTIFCVKNFTESEISNKAKIEDTLINLKLDFTNDGINVNVEYPLKLSLGKEEFFQLSQFDFFYPTKFNILLDAAVARPIFYDWKFVDFLYTKDTLELSNFDYVSTSDSCDPLEDNDNLFVCKGTLLYDKYKSLAIEMEELPLPNGDTILTFKSPEVLNLPEPYEFRFAIQNRPPALDYVNQLACIVEDDPETLDIDESINSYDYLVVPGHQNYGKIDITLNVLDADGDEIVDYSFESELTNENTDDPKKFTIDDVNLPAKIYEIKATATDEHQLSDWQDVRVLVDTSLDGSMDIWYPYEIEDAEGNVVSYSELVDNFISLEDPVFVNITYPEDSVVGKVPKAQLDYSVNDENVFLENLIKPVTLFEDACYNFPYGSNNFCNPSSYFLEYEPSFDQFVIEEFGEVGSAGKFKLSLSQDYCFNTIENPQEVEVTVVQCIPHVNPTHPYASPYHETTYGLTTTGTTDFANPLADEPISPFLATHSCCDDFTFANEDQECYSGEEELGCFGTKDNPDEVGSILSKRVFKAYCSGTRGNLCGNDYKDGNVVESHENKCGNKNTNPNCNKVAPKCYDQDPYYYETGPNGFWCQGDYGCGENNVACTTEIVSPTSLGLAELSGQFVCDCSHPDAEENNRCWILENGDEGTCQGGTCKIEDE
ncbi:hypothetical protein HOA91_00930 [Candidatus Woesearchaeota archaeon]|jgi:hypothetical protein|nr:hypothetical protein [Candidatus Woesearchaeota archaeon]